MPEPDVDAAAERLDRLVAEVEQSAEPRVRERVFEILEAIDALHRPLVLVRLGDLGPDVDVEDLSYSSIDLLFLLQRRDAYGALILVAAVPRGDSLGTVRVVPWSPPPIATADLQSRIAETLSGVIDVENHLRVLEHFGALPPRVLVVEIEPGTQSFGAELSPEVARAVDEAAARVRWIVAEAVAT